MTNTNWIDGHDICNDGYTYNDIYVCDDYDMDYTKDYRYGTDEYT